MVAAAALPAKPIILYDLLPEPGVCPYAQRAKVALREKKLPYEQKLISAQAKPQEFLDLFRSITSNPNGRGTVPTIIESNYEGQRATNRMLADGDVKLTESNVVVEYLDAAYPESGARLIPTDAKKLAQVKLFVELFTAEVQSNIGKQVFTESKKELAAAQAGLTHGLKVVDAFLKDHGLEGGEFLLGSEFSYAEVATLPFLYRAKLVLKEYRGFDIATVIQDHSLRRLDRWLKAGFERPSIKDTLPGDDVIISHSGNRFKQVK